MRIVLGMGCDRGASVKTLSVAIENALKKMSLSIDQVSSMATIDKKSDEVGLLDLARDNEWKIHFFSADQLAQIEVPNPSEVVMKYMGTPAVAEAAAMLAANTGMHDLILEKYKYLGSDGKNATVSIVRLSNE